MQFTNRTRKEIGADRWQRSKPVASNDVTSSLPSDCFHILDLSENDTGAADDLCANRCHDSSATRAFNQRDAQLSFSIGNLLGQAWLTDAQELCCVPEPAGVCYRHDILHLSKGGSHSSEKPISYVVTFDLYEEVYGAIFGSSQAPQETNNVTPNRRSSLATPQRPI